MKITKEIFLSFLACPYKAYLLLKGESGNKSEYEVLFKEMKEKYCADGLKKFSVKQASLEMIRDTNLKNKNGVVYQAPIGQQDVHSDSCIMERVRGGSEFGRFHYIPVIFTPKQKLSQEDRLEIAYDGFILKTLQSRRPEYGKVFCGDSFKTTKLRIGSQIEKVKNIVAKIKKINLDSPPKIILNRHCQICEFKDACRAKAIEKDDLSLLAGIPPREIEAQNKKGVFTVTQYSYTFRSRKKFRKAYPFNLKALALREKKIHLYGTLGISTSDVQIYLDVEGDPERDFYYLIGLVIIENGIEKRHSFWADNEAEERGICLEFVNCMRSYGNYKLYHYGSYETKFMQKVQSYMHDPDDVRVIEGMLVNAVNVLSIVYEHVFFPTYSNGLKDIGTYLGVKWTRKDASGINSLVWRECFDRTKNEVLKNRLIEYNLEDCFALKSISEFINKISMNQREKIDKNIEVVYADNVKEGSSYAKWGKVDFIWKDLEHINNCAYFDYQREKVFVRTDKRLLKAKSKPRRNIKRAYPVNKKINVKFRNRCPKCGKRMYRWVGSSKQVIDLKFAKAGVKRWVEFYQIYKKRCSRCSFLQTDTTLRDLPKYGHSLKSFVIYNNVVNHQTFDNISDALRDFFDISISGPCLNNFKNYFSEYYQETYQQILKRIIQGKMVHADETQISINKQIGYVWVLANMEEVYFLYRPTREGQFLNDLFKDYKGVLISDFYAAYDSLACLQQKCLIHLIRDLNDDLRANPFDEEYKNLAAYFTLVLRQIVDTVDRHGLKKRNLNKHKRMVNKFFEKAVSATYTSDLAQKYQKRFKKNQEKLFTFLNYDGVPWNNNNAEHALKNFAVSRYKMDFHSEDGLKNQLIFLSIYQTCRNRGINFLKFLVSKEKDIDRFSQGRTQKHFFIGSSEYSLGEFCREYIIDGLVKALRDRGINMPKGSGIEVINSDVLTNRDLYKKYSDVNLTKEDQGIIAKINNLNENEIKRFNRSLIERGNPHESPKNHFILDDANKTDWFPVI